MTIKEGEIVTNDEAHDNINEENDESGEFSEEDPCDVPHWLGRRTSHHL